jgi:CHASE2 domain-containing sensor protein
VIVAAWISNLVQGMIEGRDTLRMWIYRSAVIGVSVGAIGGTHLFLHFQRISGNRIDVAWPWNLPIGFFLALTLGYLLAGRRREAA